MNETYIDVDWRFDISFFLLQHWSSKSHANCDFSVFSLTESIITSNTSKNISNSIYSSSSSFSSTATSASTIICSNIYARVIEASHKRLFEELLEELLEKEKFSRFSRLACLFSEKNWFYDKRYMLKAHATVKYTRKKCLLKIIVAETSIWKKKIVSRFLSDNTLDITWSDIT